MKHSFPVEYNFDTAKLDLLTKNGHLKDKYICLPYMITLPLSSALIQLPDTQPVPDNKIAVFNAVDTNDGWLNYTVVQNVQPNIVSLIDNLLYFNKFSYNYKITIDVISRGDTTVPLRLMAQNPFSLLASNMNDVYGNETVVPIVANQQQINFTVTGQYQYFYIYFPTTNFNLNITITVDYTNYPPMICDKSKKCDKKCDKKSKKSKCNKCTCYTVDGNGYMKIKNCDKSICVPVYTTRVIGNVVNQYLYPEFDYLRDLFYNVTLANSLPLPPVITSNDIQSNAVTVMNCRLSADYWCNYLSESPTTDVDVQFDRLVELTSPQSGKYLKYSWSDTPGFTTPDVNQYPPAFCMYYLWGGAWYLYKGFYKLIQHGTLPAGEFINNSGYTNIAFGINVVYLPGEIYPSPTGVAAVITVTQTL